MPIINIKQFNINSLRKQFSFNKPSNQKFSFEILFTLLIILGIPLNYIKIDFMIILGQLANGLYPMQVDL